MLQPQTPGLPKFLADLFNNTQQNNILLMDTKGIIMAVNPAFTRGFGYQFKDLVGKEVSVLFTPEDRKLKLPEKELNAVLSTGQGYDNNYLVALGEKFGPKVKKEKDLSFTFRYSCGRLITGQVLIVVPCNFAAPLKMFFSFCL